jgi:hypothetical protein
VGTGSWAAPTMRAAANTAFLLGADLLAFWGSTYGGRHLWARPPVFHRPRGKASGSTFERPPSRIKAKAKDFLRCELPDFNILYQYDDT